MKKGLAIFDLDETLVRSDFTWALSGGRFLEKQGITHGDELCNAFKDHGVSFVISLLQKKYGINKSDNELFESLTEETLNDYKVQVSLKNLASETVSLFRSSGFFTCVLSANSPRVLEIIKNRFSSDFQMDGWFSTRYLPWTKGSPRVYDLISGYFGVKPSDCVLFDDAPYAIKTAVSMRMPFFWICDSERCFVEQPEISHFSSFAVAMPKIKEFINR